MSVLHPRIVRCACGAEFPARVADTVNGGRSPVLRRMILEGTLHRAACPRCKHEVTVESSFSYVDLARGAFYHVHPRGARHRWREASALLDGATAEFPCGMLAPDARTLRVVFGMDELREKLVAQDLEIDDVAVELLKVLLLYDHPFLRKRPRLRLTLDGATTDAYRFVASSDHDPRSFALTVPFELAKGLWTPGHPLAAWAADRRAMLLADDAHWVNVWRCSPQPGSLAQLRAYLRLRESDGDAAIPTESDEFARMVAGLPSGDHLPRWAKQGLRAMADIVDAKGPPSMVDALFEKRFGFRLEDDWGTHASTSAVGILWKVLDDLPDREVEGSTAIAEIELDTESGQSRYRPDARDIVIAVDLLDDPAAFARTLRHEVGHAVHAANAELVEAWLTQLGWRSFPNSREGLDEWVELLGGWADVTPEFRDDVARFVLESLGRGEHWGPTPSDAPQPATSPWYAAPTPAVRRAFEGSVTDWFREPDAWFRTADHAFFLNYYYATFVAVRLDVLRVIRQMPDPYAGMSASEFFAELYAVHRDPDRAQRERLPAELRDWLEQHFPTDMPDDVQP